MMHASPAPAGRITGWLCAGLLLSVSAAVSSVSRTHPAAPGGTFRVATFNIHKGADRRGHYDLQRTIEAIAALEADVVGVQEALRNDPAVECADQPALIAEGLRRLTGRPWTYAYVKAWITSNRECLRRGAGDDAASEGLAVFAPDRILATSAVRLSEGRIGLAARVASLPDVPVVVTHLSANRSQQEERAREVAGLLAWAAQFRAGILMGDFNAQPDASELAPVFASYRDAWAEAAGRGLASGVESGATRPGRRGSRIDYVVYSPDAGLALDSVMVVDTSAPSGLTEVSDHRPVVATFRRPVQP